MSNQYKKQNRYTDSVLPDWSQNVLAIRYRVTIFATLAKFIIWQLLQIYQKERFYAITMS